MKHTFAVYCLALSGASFSGASAGVVRPSLTTTPVAQASLTLPGQTLSLPRPSNVLIHARQDNNNNNNNAQIQQLQQQEQQVQQRNSASLSSISSSFSSRLTSLSSSASSTISQLQTSLQSAQQAVNTLQQSANDASRSAGQASQSAASAMASVQSSAASAQAALSSSLQASMVASAASAEQVMSISMSSVMVAAVASVSASFVAQQAAAIANLPSPPTASATAAVNGGFLGTVPEANGAASPQSQQSSLLQTSQQTNVLGACTTPEVVLAFAGIVLGAVGLASLGCIVFLWFWKRRPAVRNSSDKKTSGRGSTGGASGTGLSGESRSSGGSLRQWRIRASTTRPKLGSTAASPSDVSLKEYKLPEYERVFPENKETNTARPATSSPTKMASSATVTATPAPAESTAPTATAVSTNDRIFSAWSFTTAGGGDTSTGNNNNNNGSTFFEANSPTSSARDVVAPLNVYQNQHQQRPSRNFSRTSRAFPPSNAGVSKPRPTSSVYEPFGQDIRSEPRGLDRISRMEEEWNRSQMQRATTNTTGANKASNSLYATNYAYYASNGNGNGNGGNTLQKDTTTSRYGSKDSADSLAREYHDFVSQLAPVSQYGATPAATAAVASSGASSATSLSSGNRTQREPTVPPAGPLPGLPSRGNDDSEAGTGFSIRPYLQGLI